MLLAMADSDSSRSGRRGFLKKTAAVGALGLSSAIGVASAGSFIEVPIVKRGDEILKTRRVPREWWEHVKRARRINAKYTDEASEESPITDVRTTLDTDTIGGRNKMKIVLGTEDGATLALPQSVQDVPVETGQPAGISKTCFNHQEYTFVPGGVPFGNDSTSGTAGCQVIDGGNERMITASHLWGCSGQNNSTAHQYTQEFGQTTGVFNESLDYMLVENTAGDNTLGGAIEHDGGSFPIGGRATNYEVLHDEDVTIHKTGIHTGSTTGEIAATNQSVAYDCANFNGLLYTNDQAGGDSGTVAFMLDDRKTGPHAVITGLATGGGGTETQINCHGSQIRHFPYAAGPTSEQIHNDCGCIFTGGTTSP